MAKKSEKCMTVQERIEKEKNKLLAIFKDLPKDVKNTAEKLIDNAAFMAVTLEDLQVYINENGCTESYQNGANQSGKKKSSEVEVYNTMIKNYKTIIDTLLVMVPASGDGDTHEKKKNNEDDDEDIENFANRRQD